MTPRTQARWQQTPVWARIAAGASTLIVVCACCALGLAVFNAAGSPSPTANASSTATTAATQAPAAPTETPKPLTWQTVQHFTGSQNQQTATFHLPDGARIVWTETLTNTDFNEFAVELYNSDGSLNDLIVNNANDTSNQSSTYNVHGDADVYLKVTSDQVNYDIQVQVQQ